MNDDDKNFINKYPCDEFEGEISLHHQTPSNWVKIASLQFVI